MLVIFDLDETCIHSVEVDKAQPAAASSIESFVLSVNGEPEYRVYVRPHFRQLLAWLRANKSRFSYAVWSAAEKSYVIDIVERLFGADEPPKCILWHEHAQEAARASIGGSCLKNLNWFCAKFACLCESGVLLIDDLRDNCEHESRAFQAPPFELANSSTWHNDRFFAFVQQVLASQQDGNM